MPRYCSFILNIVHERIQQYTLHSVVVITIIYGSLVTIVILLFYHFTIVTYTAYIKAYINKV